MGDFNATESNPAMETFLTQLKCKNIIKSKICYKSQEGSCIDLIIKSRPNLHHIVCTGVSTLLKNTTPPLFRLAPS